MSSTAIQRQIDAIQRITDEALKSKAAARKLLADAGIIKQEGKKSDKKKSK